MEIDQEGPVVDQLTGEFLSFSVVLFQTNNDINV